ncbi:MAG: glycosyltransferase [Flavobacteriales bacterium]|nr:glycosyltransferase [Flavobacteriales bacterium]
MRVLHITNWYPNVIQPGETPFIRRHIEALAPHCENEVWHVEVRQAGERRTLKHGPAADRTFIRISPLERWYLIEWLSTLMVLWMWWTRDRSKRYDIVNFHVAYPLLTHQGLLRFFIRKPFVITEHWTAYHFQFNTAAKGLDRIRRIFHKGTPLICVSNTLAGDIAAFAKLDRLPVAIIDNVVDSAIFHPAEAPAPVPGRFFGIASWRAVKRSDVMIKTIAILRRRGRDAELRLAGGGKGLQAMEKLIAELGLEDHVKLLGQLDAQQVADELRNAHALMHCSDYETYSVVCAESLCCGTPVFVSDLEAVNEYLEADMGRAIVPSDPEVWADEVEAHWQWTLDTDRRSISERMTRRADAASVGKRYHQVLQQVVANNGRLPVVDIAANTQPAAKL